MFVTLIFREKVNLRMKKLLFGIICFTADIKCTVDIREFVVPFIFMNWFRWQRGLRRRYWFLGHWVRGFEFRSRHRCLYLRLCTVLSCVGSGLCKGLITCPKET
jgi:hypothetical protein